MRPPRALWVPFELGRPFGVPDDAAFQHGVLRAALELLEAEAGPVLVDYDQKLSGHQVEADAEGWSCPISFGPLDEAGANSLGAALQAEVDRLQPWFDLSVGRRGRTTVGASGLEVPDIVRLIAAIVEPNPTIESSAPSANLLKLATEDLKAFYFEAALAQPDGASSLDVQNWFWSETAAASILFRLRETLIDSDDAATQRFANWLLVPQTQAHRLRASRNWRPAGDLA